MPNKLKYFWSIIKVFLALKALSSFLMEIIYHICKTLPSTFKQLSRGQLRYFFVPCQYFRQLSGDFSSLVKLLNTESQTSLQHPVFWGDSNFALSAAPVPLPGTIWPLMAGLTSVAAIKKRNHIAATLKFLKF